MSAPRPSHAAGRSNQRLRTRKDLLRAAARLLKAGETPTMDGVADEALVSRATAYRYFANIDALLIEAPLDGAVPDPAELFADSDSEDPIERVDQAEAALHEMIYANEAKLRRMLALSLSTPREDMNGTPARQNRRTPLVEAALEPARHRFDDESYDRLLAALALVFGTESAVIFRDVLPLEEREARKVKRWTIAALIRAALEDSA